MVSALGLRQLGAQTRIYPLIADQGPRDEEISVQDRYNWRREKESSVVPKRQQMKHLNFNLLFVRDQGVGDPNPLSPTI